MKGAEPRVWLGLLAPEDPNDAESLVVAALETGRPIDISSAPARWGGMLRGTDAFLTSFGGQEVENATDTTHAINLVHAELIQTLSSIGRDYIDALFLCVRRRLAEHQIEGALTALNAAKSDGAVRNVGLYAERAESYAILEQAEFDVLITPDNPLQPAHRQVIEPIAKASGLTLASCRTLNWGNGIAFSQETDLIQSQIATKAYYGHVLVGVRSASEVRTAISAETKPPDLVVERLIEEVAKRRLTHA